METARTSTIDAPAAEPELVFGQGTLGRRMNPEAVDDGAEGRPRRWTDLPSISGGQDDSVGRERNRERMREVWWRETPTSSRGLEVVMYDMEPLSWGRASSE